MQGYIGVLEDKTETTGAVQGLSSMDYTSTVMPCSRGDRDGQSTLSDSIKPHSGDTLGLGDHMTKLLCYSSWYPSELVSKGLVSASTP